MRCLNRLGKSHDCGKCINCRVNLQQQKKMRLVHECQYHDKKCFITLTYSDYHLPANGSLVRADPQLYMKRLRKRIDYPVKAFGCGEYGDTTERPHYHIIVYGLDMRDNRVFKAHHYVPSKKCYYVECPAWKFGHVTVAPVNDARCAYVAKYCVKKLTGSQAATHYNGRLPEFCFTSRGIGLEWAEDHKKQLVRDGFVREAGKRKPIPRYYLDKVFTEAERKERINKINDEVLKKLMKEWQDCKGDVVQLRKDKLDAEREIIGRRMHRKVKGNNSV